MKHPAIFLKTRLDNLYDEASRSQGSWEASKLLCLGGSITAGVAAATNPLMMLFSVGAGVAYAWSVVKEGSRSMKLKPLPIFTQSIGELLSGAAGGDDESEPLPNDLRYLPPEQVTETLLLDFQIQSVARFLSSIEEAEREQAYKQLVKYFHHQYGAIAQHRPSLLFNSEPELREAFESALSFPAFEEEDTESLPQTSSLSTETTAPQNLTASVAIIEIDIAEYLFSPRLGQDLKSILIGGESGAGKGNTLYGLANSCRAVYPNARLFAINPKPTTGESRQWDGFESVIAVTNAEEAIAAMEYVEMAVDEMIDRQLTGDTEDPYILVLDEYNTFRDLLTDEDLRKLTKMVSRIARQGRSEKVWLWVAMHTGNCKDVNMSASDRTNFIRIAVGFQSNCDALQIAIANPAMFPGLKVAPGLISSLKTQGFGIGASSLFDKIFRLPNYLEKVGKPMQTKVSENLFQPVAAPAVSGNLVEEYREILSPTELTSPDVEISNYLKKAGIRKSDRKGIAIFKVWKWAKDRSESISLNQAIERFRKDRGAKMTKLEIHWALDRLQFLHLVEYADSEQRNGTKPERTEQAP